MLRNETRGDREWLERHVAPDFIDFGGERANRSSMCTRSDDGWVLRFRQATPRQ